MPNAEGWLQAGELGLSLLLSAVIGLEREVRQKSAGLRDLAEAAELIVSELVTNAVRASTGADGRPRYGEAGLPVVILRLTTDAARVLIEVWDDIPAGPVAEQAGPEDESGRGIWCLKPGWGQSARAARLGPRRAGAARASAGARCLLAAPAAARAALRARPGWHAAARPGAAGSG